MSQLDHQLGDIPIRLGPVSTRWAPGRAQGRCAACDALISRKDRVVRMYGEVFHSECAFYTRSRRS